MQNRLFIYLFVLYLNFLILTFFISVVGQLAHDDSITGFQCFVQEHLDMWPGEIGNQNPNPGVCL